jgi:hypothetical protein
MKRNICRSAAVSTLLGAAVQTASAVSLNPHGVGQALIFPYYTVDNGEDTLISLVNPTNVGKAVQVRFHEGFNGRDALDFVVYLSPHDVWTAAMTKRETNEAEAIVRTSDASCSGLPVSEYPLTSAGYDGDGPPYPADGGPADIFRTHEGWIEIIAGADIVAGSPTDLAIAHAPGHAPTCDGLPPTTAADFKAPTGGIYGSASIVNVGQGTFFAYNADAIQDFTDKPLLPASSTVEPTLQDANSAASADGGAIARIEGDGSCPQSLDYHSGIDAVSAVLMADTLYGEYLTADSLGANTDWILTFPTKAFYVDKRLYPGNSAAPFEHPFADGVSNVSVSGVAYDREGNGTPFTSGTGPGLQYEVNVLPVRTGKYEPSGVFGSETYGMSVAPTGEAGHIALDFSGNAHVLEGGRTPDGKTVTLSGLPVTGFMAYNIVNANAQHGVLANYGGTFALRGTESCAGH